MLFVIVVGICGVAFIMFYWTYMHEYLQRRMRLSLAHLDEVFET
jgi:uncharacterized membrane protein YuzA (DUF378 family)